MLSMRFQDCSNRLVTPLLLRRPRFWPLVPRTLGPSSSEPCLGCESSLNTMRYDRAISVLVSHLPARFAQRPCQNGQCIPNVPAVRHQVVSVIFAGTIIVLYIQWYLTYQNGESPELADIEHQAVLDYTNKTAKIRSDIDRKRKEREQLQVR